MVQKSVKFPMKIKYMLRNTCVTPMKSRTHMRFQLLSVVSLTAALAVPVAHAQAQLSQAVPQVRPVPPRERPALPAVDLTPQLMNKLLLAEIALQRGQAEVGVRALLDVARETNDVRVAQRATETAWNARMTREALEAAGLWLKADPESPQARKVMVALIVGQEKLTDVREPLARWLAADAANVSQVFPQIAQLLARNQDKKAVFELLRDVGKPYNNVPEVRLAVAQAAWAANDVDASLAESRAALKLKPELELAALFQAQALQKKSNGEAITFLGDYLKAYPKARDVRLAYARVLAADKRQAAAREQFELLYAEAPKNADLAMAVASLAAQTNDLDAAEKYLKAALDAGHKEPDQIWMMLGQISEDRKNFDEALRWYGGITSGDRFMIAQARYANVLYKQGKLDEARKHLQSVSPRNAAQAIQLVQAEANLLREAQQYQVAYDLLGKTLEGAPESVDLLYDQAMIADKVDRVDVLERNLRKVIELQPEHAHAHNALGYTLAERNLRLPEAKKLIERALQLSPQDGYIVDSLGWVLYRMGNYREAIAQLRRAYELRPEAEVGAHLGEVLWVDGKQDEARKVWADMLKEGPTNDTLLNTLKRFAPAMLPASASVSPTVAK